MHKKMKSKTKLSPAEQADHERSVYDYPWLDLEDDEYVVIDVDRTNVGRFFIWICTIAIFGLFIALGAAMLVTDTILGDETLSIICAFFALISILAGVATHWIYNRNRLIVTNQRVFGRSQTSLFSYQFQTLELEHVEDVSYTRNGLLPTIFDYGTLRMSTVGDEHTYKLTFIDSPKTQTGVVKKVVNAVDDQETTKYRK